MIKCCGTCAWFTGWRNPAPGMESEPITMGRCGIDLLFHVVEHVCDQWDCKQDVVPT